MRVVVGDLEANGLLKEATRIWCGVFKDVATNEKWKFTDGESICKFLDSVDTLIMHNGIGYDFPLLEKLHGYKFKGEKVDTLIMSRLLNPKRTLPPHCPNRSAGPHSIEAWGWRVGRGKPEHNDWDKFSPEMLHRCDEDVEILHLVLKELKKEHSGKNWRNAFKLTFKLFEYLQKQEEYGWKVDVPYMHKCVHQLQHWIDRIDKTLTPHLPLITEIEETKKDGEYNYIKKPFLKNGEYSGSVANWYSRNGIDAASMPVGGPFSRVQFRITNLNSNDETKTYLLNSGWEPLEWNYNDEGDRTSPKLSKDDPFEGINGAVGRLVAKRVQCRQRKSIIEGLLGLVRSDGAISSVINNLAVTGRATHRNIVNMPGAKSFYGKQMRKIFIAREGMVLVGTDSDSCQIRMLAGRMNDPNYTETILNGNKDKGTDLHSVNRDAAGLPTRDDAKTFFYGFLFGAGDAKIGKIVRGTSADGARLKAQFLQGLPALGRLIESLQTEWRNNASKRFNAKWNKMEYYNGWVTGLDGRPIFVPSEHQILVYVLQSDEAIMMTAAYNKFHIDMEKRGYVYGKDYGVLCWYHDEFTVECVPELADEVSEIAEQAIAWAGRYYKISCPHIGDAQIGKNWWEIH